MSISIPGLRDVLLGALALVGALTAASCGSSTPSTPAAPPVTPDTWAVVDGRPITRDDVEKAYRRMRDPGQTISEEEVLAGKLTLLNDLIVQDLLLAKARAAKIEIPTADLDTAFANAKKNMPDDAFQQELTKRNLTADDMREGLRRELLTQKVIEQELAPKTAVTDQMVTDFYNANRAQFNVAEESYHIAQIVVTPFKDNQIANSSGDDATTPQAAVAKVQTIMERLKAGGSFREMAAGYSEDPESAPRGGDMGLVPLSALKKLSPQLRNAVVGKTPGSVNAVNDGAVFRLVLIVAHEPAGQRDLNTPGLKDQISQTLKGRKEQLLRMAYLTSLRSDADVTNYLARRVVETSAAAPGLLTPPGK
jgi:peptidyl-prolyl cis-trans isomerase SurA